MAITNTEQQLLSEYTEQAYLDYAMYVILDRALPNIGDGLKPVQRRIIYAMSELNLNSNAKFKKSARTIGDVLGKFHPHGDSACYEAMVLMAQDFSYRYPLITGQGNWGSPDDPKSFAAMRYTEAKLSKYADLLLSEVEQGTVAWVNNFDGTLQEPKILPAQLPNILLNGTTGIAVGMATDVPPHNLTEVINACVALLDDPKLTLKELTAFIPGPDFPTDAEIITSKQELQEIYSSGYGSVKMRGVYSVENNEIIITALPYQVSGAKLLEQIAGLMQKKKLPLIADLRDESDHENPTRLVIVPKSNKVDADDLMAHLFAVTELEKAYRVNLNLIGLDGKPKVFNLLELLTTWLEFRINIVKNRLQHRLSKIVARLHILEGYLTAYLNIDAVIDIIRNADDPKANLMAKYKLTEQQAQAILELKLRHLAKLEEVKIQGEQQNLATERVNLEKILNSDKRLKTFIKKELLTISKNYGDPRRSAIVTRSAAKILDITTKITSEPMTVILSNKGWVRAAKGHDIDINNLSYKSGDSYGMHVLANSAQECVFLDSTGRSYSILVNSLPSARGYGEPVTSKFEPPPGALFTTILVSDKNQDYLLLNSLGYGFIINFNEMLTKNRKGKACLNLATNSVLLPPIAVPKDLGDDLKLALLSTDSKLLIISLQQVPVMAKGRGKKLFAAHFDDSLISHAVIFNSKQRLVVVGSKKRLELNKRDLEYYMGTAGKHGHKLPKGFIKIKELKVL